MEPFRWMTVFTPQEEWIERRGVLLWLAFFLSEAGAGAYLVSLHLDFRMGCVSGLVLSSILGGILHLGYLGKPLRAWRAVLRPSKSELSRGMLFMLLFTAFGVLQTAPFLLPFTSFQWQAGAKFLKVIMTVLSFLVMTHGFVTMSTVKAIPAWNSSILPLTSLGSGVWVGSQVAIITSVAFGEQGVTGLIEPVARWSLCCYILFTAFYFWGMLHSSPAGKESSKVILKGNLAGFFFSGVGLVGFAVPLIITMLLWGGAAKAQGPLLLVRAACAVAGDLALRYVILKGGRYVPLLSSNPALG